VFGRLRRLHQPPHAGWRLAGFLLVFAVAAALVTGLLYLMRFPKQRVNGVLQPLPLLGSAIAILGIIVAVTWLFLRFVEHRSLATVGLPPGRPWRTGISLGLLLGAIVPFSVAALLWVTGHAVIQPARPSATGLLHATLPMIGATALLSSWEEIAYRGYPLQLLDEIGGVWFGTTLAGIAFGLTHAGNPGANPLGLGNTALNGVLLGWVVLRSGSLWLACGYHTGWNLAASIVLGMRDSGISAPGSLFTTTLAGPTWLSGGAYGFEASVVAGVTEAVLLLALIALGSRLPGVPVARPYFAGRGAALG
jgi:CAAX protease family protein